ncbi:hypothetical protein PY254_14735 [Rhodanobacter sp. AS-Z3]|uniref:hypothetical protein n=1 Tax=Rhodanobacter sp. AS-Z3 TaxID=3031330 RepID=UPI00247B1EA1|nr:hypothetical protein [Rhodanobacter sp. AS-Z3]WEN14475.1 hypothetical protein PY254_14735 [Rhodanobacter sp. AS-Z3]
MTEREAAINRDLRALDDAHRLGRISRDDYRGRRRRVLQSLADGGGVVTARKALVPPSAITTSRGQHRVAMGGNDPADSGHALASLLSMRPTLTWKPLLLMAMAVALIAGMIYWAFIRH